MIQKLGWPNEVNPFGSEPTHMLVPVDRLAKYPAMSDGDMLAEIGTDAGKWADAFTAIACMANPLGKVLRGFPHNSRDELASVMLGWFANAIEAGRSAGMAQTIIIDEAVSHYGIDAENTISRLLADAVAADAAGEGMGVAGEIAKT